MENFDDNKLINKIKNDINLMSEENNKIILKNNYLTLIKYINNKISLVDNNNEKNIIFNNKNNNLFNYFDCIYITNLPDERYKIKNLYYLLKKNKCNVK